ncbi:LysR family transcriptional regulator [Pseudomonas sp. B19125]
MFDWQDLYYFTVLARTQSLSAAARELQVEHATVGRRVDALEKALGVKLVDRLPRSRPLTAQGLALAQVAAGMGDMATQVMRLSRVASIELAGTVRVSCPPSIANHCIAPQLARLRAHYPQLNLVLMPSTQLAALDKGEADIALRTLRPDEAALVRRKVGVVRFGLYAAPALEHLPAAQWTFIAYDASRDHLPQQAWLHQLRGPRPIVFAASELITQQMAARA